ncbi:O-fucosyltransferase family protein [Artemisia annua]|uniref:O-fucosyltransferase family protein n=1 Tax=Artemisia annua TaxID=35608 RepID=A0A2U1MF89_ARTAN|nr:O-fucosyltransferase family protein [Artemisia annua]
MVEPLKKVMNKNGQEVVTIIIQALGFDQNMQYVASGLCQCKVKKKTLSDQDESRRFEWHSSQMEALYFMGSVASNIFVPSYDGNMAKLVEDQ